MINIMLTKKNNQISHESFGDYVYYAIQINLMSVTLVFSVSRGSCIWQGTYLRTGKGEYYILGALSINNITDYRS